MPGRGAPTPKRYAQAVFELARERGQVDQWQEDLQAMVNAARSTGFAMLLETPNVSLSDKVQAIQEILPQLAPLASNLLALLAQHRAVAFLPRIQEEFQKLLDASVGVQRALAVTAIPLAQGDQERVARHLKEVWDREIVLSTRIDPSILGGMVIQVGDRVLDGSTRGRLQALRKTLQEAAF
ncbi:MAG: F0F1 ATP synthase subunit delta [Chloroflexi bacterium]|nr:F0F1 ATP synthase subunit delta [Chloroflexota bacterium]